MVHISLPWQTSLTCCIDQKWCNYVFANNWFMFDTLRFFIFNHRSNWCYCITNIWTCFTPVVVIMLPPAHPSFKIEYSKGQQSWNTSHSRHLLSKKPSKISIFILDITYFWINGWRLFYPFPKHSPSSVFICQIFGPYTVAIYKLIYMSIN